jgi:GNAT superfamily N-acetyltransferase
VDFSDEAWEAIFCFRVSAGSGGGNGSGGGSVYDYVGYLTLYTFVNPIQGCRIRICQALVLPSEQGCGVGRELVLAAYRLAAGRSDVSQITVGTLHRRLDIPAPAFCNASPPLTTTTYHSITL